MKAAPPDKQMPELETLKHAVEDCYGKRLVSCAVFGSVARRAATPESDIDVLIVAEPLPRGRMSRVDEFAAVESAYESDAPKGRPLSPIIKTTAEVRIGSPLFWDMTDSVILLTDRDGFLGRYLGELRERLGRLGAQRVWKGSAWYWVLKKDFVPGEVFDL